MQLQHLAIRIQNIDAGLKTAAGRAVNRMMTIRNWLIGYHIVHYEQHGEDRAKYGEELLSRLARKVNRKGLTTSLLSRCRQFCQTYPQILATVSQEFVQDNLGSQAMVFTSNILPLRTTQTDLQVPPERLLSHLSFSHFIELLPISEPLKRTFYELEAIKGSWSVRELRRQIDSLYFERCGLSVSPEAVSEQGAAQAKAA